MIFFIPFVHYDNLSMCVALAALFAYDRVIFLLTFWPVLCCLNTPAHVGLKLMCIHENVKKFHIVQLPGIKLATIFLKSL